MRAARRQRPAAFLASAGKVTLAAALGLLAAACEDRNPLDRRRLDDASAVQLSDPELRHPVAFRKGTETLDVEVPPGADGLSGNQHVDVYRFLERYKHEAVGRLVISVPDDARDKAAIARSVQGIHDHVTAAGIDYRMRSGGRAQRLDGTPAIRLAYQRPLAVPPRCGRWPENLVRNDERIPDANWGCATQRNLAVMVDNSRDLRQPQAEDPRSGERRSATWSAYIGAPSNPAADTGGDSAKKASAAAAKP